MLTNIWKITQRPAAVSTSDQTFVDESVGCYGGAAYGEVPYGGTSAEIVVRLNDGTLRPLAVILKNVIQMFGSKLP
jgi:hypothetical protein